ncbi:hypothetical protein [Herbidospora mongoliensis]|uniref:hypothetical protein n=1 Tax=Herbidospora mongoliensis TaxID=688067 RepID=UPI0008304649|nr:hypothetical protein [Herbidospora mongoliensis]
MRVPASSTEEMVIPAGGNIVGLPAEVACLPTRYGREPDDDEYEDAAWDGSDIVILIGPGSQLAVTAGDYDIWVRLTGPSSRRPVRRVGQLHVGL